MAYKAPATVSGRPTSISDQHPIVMFGDEHDHQSADARSYGVHPIHSISGERHASVVRASRIHEHKTRNKVLHRDSNGLQYRVMRSPRASRISAGAVSSIAKYWRQHHSTMMRRLLPIMARRC